MAIETDIRALIDGYLAELPGGAVVVGVICPEIPFQRERPVIISQKGTVHDCLSADSSLTVTERTLFNIGSVTKTFTGALMPYQDGWFDVVSTRLPQVTFPGKIGDIRLLDIETYWSGFERDNDGSWFNENGATTLAQFMDELHKHNGSLPQHETGKCYSYSNFSWGLLGLCMLDFDGGQGEVMPLWSQKVSDFFRDTKLSGVAADTQPFPTLGTLEWKKMPSGFNKQHDEIFKGKFSQRNWQILGAAGNLTSSGSSMYDWLAYNMGCFWEKSDERTNRILGAMQLNHYQADHKCGEPGQPAPTTTLAWSVNKFNDKYYLSKDGGVNGFTAYVAFQDWVWSEIWPSPCGVFVLTNSQGAPNHPDGAAGLGTKIMRMLLRG